MWISNMFPYWCNICSSISTFLTRINLKIFTIFMNSFNMVGKV
jgi:hypothetical protein